VPKDPASGWQVYHQRHKYDGVSSPEESGRWTSISRCQPPASCGLHSHYSAAHTLSTLCADVFEGALMSLSSSQEAVRPLSVRSDEFGGFMWAGGGNQTRHDPSRPQMAPWRQVMYQLYPHERSSHPPIDSLGCQLSQMTRSQAARCRYCTRRLERYEDELPDLGGHSAILAGELVSAHSRGDLVVILLPNKLETRTVPSAALSAISFVDVATVDGLIGCSAHHLPFS
jgi:hypothetical protein